MSANIDWSQFEPVNTSSPQGEIDWSQFEPVEKAQEERSIPQQAGRIAGQYALGAAESALLPYELGVAPLASKEAQLVPYRENLGEDIENLLLQKQTGIWSPQDQQLLDNLTAQMQDIDKSQQFIKTADIGVRGLAEKATGLNLQPEGIAEKAANWAGFVKDPRKIADLAKTGIKLPQIMKALAPTGKEALRGLGAGIALDLAEEGEFGPIGTMAATIAGDIIGGGASGIAKGVKNLATQPKKTIAEAMAALTPKNKLDLQKDLIKDFRESGLHADIGTITDSNLIKFMQSRLAQSGLTGSALDDLKKQLTQEIKDEYKGLAESLGESRFAAAHEAGEVAREGLKKIRDADLAKTRQFYSNATKALKENAFVPTQRLASAIEKLEKELKPGQIKSGEQKAVLDALASLKRDVVDASGRPMYGSVKDLMNNKIALNDIINYEVQGGAKQLLKGIVAELDRAIISHGKDNPTFARNYINANRNFSEHAKTFRNKNVEQMLRAPDPTQIINKMNSVQGIRDIEKVLSKSPEGRDIFKGLKRLKLDKVIGDNMVDSTTNQIKFGNFSKLLEKGKNREILKEILGPQAYKRLERLQKNSGRLADTAQKFFNASKTGSTVEDVALISKTLTDLAHILSANPWPIIRTTGAILGARYLTRLISNPEFLKLAEEAVLAADKNNTRKLISTGRDLLPLIKAAQLSETK